MLDGDTVELTAVLGPVWRVRLLDCWAHETRRGPEWVRERGRAAAAYALDLLDDARQCWVWIPAPAAGVLDGEAVNLLSLATFDRILGHVFVSNDATLSELMVRAGHAYRTKRELLDAEAKLAAERGAA